MKRRTLDRMGTLWNTFLVGIPASDTEDPERNWDEFYIGRFAKGMYYLRCGN